MGKVVTVKCAECGCDVAFDGRWYELVVQGSQVTGIALETQDDLVCRACYERLAGEPLIDRIPVE